MTEQRKGAVALYLRQSLDRDGKGTAVARQETACLSLVAQRWPGREVARYVDNDTSASGKVARPGYRRLLADIEAGQVSAVAVWALDRLHRQPIELEHFIALADRKALALATASGDVDLSTDQGRFVARVMGAFARNEVERKGARQVAANVQRAEAGKPGSGRRAFGYEYDRVTLREPEAVLLRRAYSDILAGVSLAEITRQWRQSGVGPTQKPDGAWTRNSIREILLNPRNAGMRAYKGEVIGQAVWPPIVSADTWHAARALIMDPSRRTSPTTARRWLLTTIARCGECGGPMQAHWSTPTNGTRRRRYLCKQKGCVTRTAEFADTVVSKAIVARLSEDDARQLLIDEDRPDVTALMSEADTLRRRQDDLAAAFADGEITRGQLATGTEKLRVRLTELEQRMSHTDRAPLLRSLVEADDVAAEWEALPLDRQRAVLALLMKVTIRKSPVGKRPTMDSIGIDWLI